MTPSLTTVTGSYLDLDAAKKLAEIDEACFEKDAFNYSDWLDLFKEGPVYVTFAWKGATIVGAGVWQEYTAARTGYLVSNAVLPEYRNKGVGRALLIARLNRASDLGMKYIFAHTRVSNRASQCLLESQGFEPNSFCGSFYGEEDGIEWKLKLDQFYR